MADYAFGSIRPTTPRPTDMRAQAKLLRWINVICPVQSRLQKYSRSLFTRITSGAAPVPPLRGAYRDRHGPGPSFGGLAPCGSTTCSQGAVLSGSDRAKLTGQMC